MNSKDEILLRKFNNNIYVSGLAVLAFGIWSVIRLFISLFMGLDAKIYNDAISEISAEGKMYFNIAFFTTIAIICLINIFIHVFIGIKAMKFSKGLAHKKWLVFWAIVAFLSTIFSIPYYLVEEFAYVDTIIASLILDISYLFLMVDLVYSVFFVEKIKKRIGEAT